MAETLAWTGDERESHFADANIRLRGFTHQSRDRENPHHTANRDALVWVWGNVEGHETDGVYRDRDIETESASEFCANLYDEVGIDFVHGLNGDFVGVVYDRAESTVSIFTDRLGTWPLYVTETENGAVVFSSHIQSLQEYPTLSLSFDEEYVVQHLSWRGGPTGVKTPLQGVETFPPGTITTYDLEDGTTTEETYWRPKFPKGGPFDDYAAFVDEFVERFQASVAERTRDRSKQYGILLSGGSDARLIMAALDDDLDITAYHMGDWMSKEARIAERIAIAKGVEFRFLRRDPEYFEEVLDRAPEMWNFAQMFNQAWAAGFIDEIRSEVDVLLTGHFADTLFKGMFVPTRFLDLGPLHKRELPFELPISTLEEFDSELGARTPFFADTDVDCSAVLARNTSREDDSITSYGLEFDSFRDFVLGRLHVPATTDPLFRQSLRENVELQMPIYDNRLLDLWVNMPIGYKLRRNVINSAVTALDPELAEIPHASTGVPVKYSRTVHRFGDAPMTALRLLSPFESVPDERLNHNPWGNHSELIRTQSYIREAIYENEELIRSLSFLDWDRVVTVYQDHLNGRDNTKFLYRLVTFLEAPITEQIAMSTNSDKDERQQGLTPEMPNQ
ncbi:asparagine synthase-related protein [Haloarcula sp. 1CSR25-25]|uniref:asparagine synthase-related protein n=1 Tax=Haloarcula sp. 1CSR25-25 TaxID=2862545 RepID=UPI002893DDF4|nr:asparagine synthase-related protein [Haloarcula sp. 1CSR25-25]MDT3435586.1 asparagine synthase [Haloarcula sp. 1CSR25-25]